MTHAEGVLSISSSLATSGWPLQFYASKVIASCKFVIRSMRPANDPVPLVMNEINCGKSLNLEMPESGNA